MYFLKPIPFLVALSFWNVHFLTHSSENGRFGRSPGPSTAKSGRFSRLFKDLTFVSKLPVLPQDSRIFRIHILFKFNILFLEAYHFQNSEDLEDIKEYTLKITPCN